MRRKNDTVIYQDEAGNSTPARVVVAVGPDGQPTGAVQINARKVYTWDRYSKAGVMEVVPEDENRTGLTIRNDSDAQMYLKTDGDAGDGLGYPIDARRGYSFEALGMLPSMAVTVWCGTAGAHIAVLYATTSEPYDA